MKVLVIAKMRRGTGACVEGISADGRSVRLVPADPEHDAWGHDFQVGDVWEIEEGAPLQTTPPHTEDVLVFQRSRVRSVNNPVPTIERFMPTVTGAPEALFGGLLQVDPSGALYVDQRGGIPFQSTYFWRPDRPLCRTADAAGAAYVYAADDGARALTFTGFQEPVGEIPAGTLVRVSLTPWQRSEAPGGDARCYLELSGWFEDSAVLPAVNGAAPDLAQVRAAMTRVFGYDEFRPLQEAVIGAVIGGRDALGIMPTGAGKSLCYQLPALVLPGLTLVVSPLLSLMQDQLDQLREAGVAAVTLNSTLSPAGYRDALQTVREGKARLLYVAPETLVREEIRGLLRECKVSCLTVDEAHCISEWGHDFRPEYRRLREIRNEFPQAVCLALTATATARVQNDIRTILGIPQETTFVAGFDRPNLHLEVRPRTDAVSQILEFIRERQDDAGIIYCNTREQVDRLVADLGANGVRAVAYHAGMPDAERRENQRLFQRDEVSIVVATVAFGMGINKSNVRFVIHHSLPDCLEKYYQQIGRAGRDGLRSECLLLFSRADVGTIFHFIEQGSPKEKAGRNARLQAMLRYAGASVCRRHPLLTYFDDTPPSDPCGMCDNCLADAEGRERVDVSEDARLFLNALLQTRERFGLTHVIGVLRGSRAARIEKWRHHELAVHGAGRHRSEEEWKLLADRFLELELAEAEPEHGTLRLSAAGRTVLEGEAVSVVLGEVRKASRVEQPGSSDPALFEALRKLRKRLADEQGVPPYVIFSDRSLSDMSASYPQTREAFLRVHGVGERRAEVYGEAFLDLIRNHVAEHGTKAPASVPSPATPPAPRGTRFMEVGEAYCRGASIPELQERWGVAQSTIINHLYQFARAGNALDPDPVLAECSLGEVARRAVLDAFERLGHERLGPVFAELGEKVPYSELHLLRVCYLAGLRADGPTGHPTG